MVRRVAFAASLLLPGLAFGQAGAFQGTVAGADVSRNPELAGVSVEQKLGARVPTEVAFIADNGKPTNFGRLLKGRPIVLLPIFYRCVGVCTTEMQGVLNALKRNPGLVPGKDVDIVALDINPKETPDLAASKKALYLDDYGHPETAAAWTFLTGSEADTRKITDAVGFKYTYDADRDRVNHPSAVMILSPTGRVSTYMLQGMYPPKRFAADVARAAKDEIGEKQDSMFFGCVMVDPITGKRSIVVQNVLKLAGVVTVLGLFGTIVGLNVRNRRRAA